MSRFRDLVQDVRVIVRPPTRSSKFVTYFELLDAFREPGCPVCTKLERGALKSLDGLMYEQVNDPYVRDRLVESHGFCNWHAWMLPGISNSALGVALIYRHLLGETLGHLHAARQEARPRGRWRRLWTRLRGVQEDPLPFLAWRRGRRGCYLCTFARRSEHDDLTTILEFVSEPEFNEGLTRSAGLCLPHLCAALAIGRDHPNLQRLIAIHEARWQDLAWELGEFARKFDYRYSNEVRGQEGSSWHRVLDLFVGRAAVFGPERGDQLPFPALGVASPVAPAGEPGRETEAGQDTEAQSLRFENEKLRRRTEELLAQRAEDHRVRLALEFQILKLKVDLKALAVDGPAAAPERAGAGPAHPGDFGVDTQASPPGGESA